MVQKAGSSPSSNGKGQSQSPLAEQQVIQDTIARRTMERADLLSEVKRILATLVQAIPEVEPLEVPRQAAEESLARFSDAPGTIPRKIATPPPPYRAPVTSGRQVGPKRYAARIVYEVNDKVPTTGLTITAEPIYFFIREHPKCNADQIQRKMKLRDGQLSGALHRLTVGGWIRTSPAKK